MENDELYKIAVQTRNMEIALFWQRSNYFMVLNTAIALGFFTQKAEPYAYVLACLGIFVSGLWFFVNLGGKYWQSRWEERASIYEMQVAPEAELFSASPEVVYSDVENNLNRGRPRGLKAFLYRLVLRKPSVSYQMIALSFFFICFWGITAIISIVSGGNA